MNGSVLLRFAHVSTITMDSEVTRDACLHGNVEFLFNL